MVALHSRLPPTQRGPLLVLVANLETLSPNTSPEWGCSAAVVHFWLTPTK